MKPIKGFDQVAVNTYKRLPVDAYVCKIMEVKHEEGKYGPQIKISLEIAEGEYANYFTEAWKNSTFEDKKWGCIYWLDEVQDDGTDDDKSRIWKLKRFTTALEESNTGYHWDWDESKWKDLLVGMVFKDHPEWKKEADIKEGDTDLLWHKAYTYCPTTVACVRSGDYKIPDPAEPKGVKPQIGSTVPGVNAYVQVADDVDEELPFK